MLSKPLFAKRAFNFFILPDQVSGKGSKIPLEPGVFAAPLAAFFPPKDKAYMSDLSIGQLPHIDKIAGVNEKNIRRIEKRFNVEVLVRGEAG